MAEGETRISGLLESEDVLNTAGRGAGPGRRTSRATAPGVWRVTGGVGNWRPPAPLDFGNSGTGSRLVMGAVATTPITAIFTGDAVLALAAHGAGARPARRRSARAMKGRGPRR